MGKKITKSKESKNKTSSCLMLKGGLIAILLISSVSSYLLYKKKYKPQLNQEEIIATAHHMKILRKDVELYLKKLENNKGEKLHFADLTAEQINNISEQIYLERKLKKLAKKSKIAKNPQVEKAINQSKEVILKEAYLRSYVNANLTEADLEKAYQKLVNSQEGKKEYEISHIFLTEMDNAKRIMTYLNSKNFAQVASKESEDDFSKKKGGDLGYINEMLLSKEVKEAILLLSDGEISAPIQTETGVQIVMLKSRRDVEVPPFAQIAKKLQKNETEKLLRSYYAKLLAESGLKRVEG